MNFQEWADIWWLWKRRISTKAANSENVPLYAGVLVAKPSTEIDAEDRKALKNSLNKSSIPTAKFLCTEVSASRKTTCFESYLMKGTSKIEGRLKTG